MLQFDFFTAMKLSNAQLLLQQQKLSPQQIQMIKLLELPTVMLEQRIKEEIEENVVLEEEHSAESEEEPQQISVERSEEHTSELQSQ